MPPDPDRRPVLHAPLEVPARVRAHAAGLGAAVASRLAHLALLDALLVGVAERDSSRSQAALAIYAEVLAEHRL